MELLKVFPETAEISEEDHLKIGALDVCEIAASYGTPLYVYDETHLRNNCRRFREAFKKSGLSSCVAYAGKAFLCVAFAELIDEEGLWLDVVTGGELYTALSGDFPPEKILFHGNNKTKSELELAVDYGIGYVVIDNFYELELLDNLLHKKGKVQKILIRITPGIIPSTHTYIQTGQVDSKFGFGLSTGIALEAVNEIMSYDRIILDGFHMHIGSQIFALESFEEAVSVMASFTEEVKKRTGYVPEVVNMGGGLGVAYKTDDNPPTIEEYVKTITDSSKKAFKERGLAVPKIMIEPGRSVVANAGVTLYSVGAIKEIPGIRVYASVDGGMSDNIRPMLYGAAYEAFLANKMTGKANSKVTVAGKHCESGDILVRDVWLPNPEPRDILVIPATGAYGYSMANNYNLQPRPAVLFVKENRVRKVISRESYQDIISLHSSLYQEE